MPARAGAALRLLTGALLTGALLTGAVLVATACAAPSPGSPNPGSPTPGASAPTSPAPGPPGTARPPVRLPPPDGRLDYQLGGAYPPDPAVRVVSRDRTEEPVPGLYNICYVNLLQTQPDQPGRSGDAAAPGTTSWWDQQHPDLLLRDARGRLVVDPDWDEALLDVSTPAKRARLMEIQRPWFDGCREAGYDAVEPDNLDADLRSGGRLTFAQTRAHLQQVVPYLHSIGLAVAQKNTADPGYGATGPTFVDTVSPAQGFDFAVVEECAAYQECHDYTDVYGGRVYVVEYTDHDPGQTRDGVTRTAYDRACQDLGETISIILRDRDVVPAGEPGYVYRSC